MTSPISILFVEDSKDDTELILLQLEKEYVNIEWNRVDTKADLQTQLIKRDWDVVISDFNMPGFSGLDALETVKKIKHDIPFVIVSGAIGERKAVELIQKGVQDYVLKDNLIRLPAAVKQAIEKAQAKRNALINRLKLEESNKRLSTIYNAATDAMCLLKVERKRLVYESVNDSFVINYSHLLKSISRDEIIGLTSTEFMRDKVKMPYEQIMRMNTYMFDCAKKGKTGKIVEKFILNGNPYFSEFQVIPIVEKETCTHLLCVSRDVTQEKIDEIKIKEAYLEAERIKVHLEQENLILKEEMESIHDFSDIIFKSDSIKKILRLLEQVAPVDATVLVTGETGTGKELMVRALHKMSHRKDGPLIKVNCGALPKDLIESELFGHEKGAFTGADKKKLGRFALAHNGTLFLDEIGELPLSLQPKLLRVLQEGEFQPVGGTESVSVDVRVVAATNKNLSEEMSKGNFREDLYYRLEVFPIHMPPLRERVEDIAPLISYFIKKYAKKFGKPEALISTTEMAALESYLWPGNVRELENLVERAMILSQDEHLQLVPLLGFRQRKTTQKTYLTTLSDVEKSHLIEVLKRTRWKINGPGGAANALGLTPSTLRDRMKKHGIKRPD